MSSFRSHPRKWSFRNSAEEQRAEAQADTDGWLPREVALQLLRERVVTPSDLLRKPSPDGSPRGSREGAH